MQQREKSGHGISVDLIEKRYENSQENLKLIFGLCDIVQFYDNTIAMKEVCFFKDNEFTCNFNEIDWNNDFTLSWVKILIQSIYENKSINFKK